MPKIVPSEDSKMLMTSMRLSQGIKRQIEAYAKQKRISEAEVYRRAILNLINEPKRERK